MKKKICMLIVSAFVLFVIFVFGFYFFAAKNTLKGSGIYVDENHTVQCIDIKDRTRYEICAADFIYQGSSYRFESFSKTDACDFYGIASSHRDKIIVYFNDGEYFAAAYEEAEKPKEHTYNGNAAYLENGFLHIRNCDSETDKIAEADDIYGWVGDMLLFENEKAYFLYCNGQIRKLPDKLLRIVGQSDENSAVICRWRSEFPGETNYITCFYSLKYHIKIAYPFDAFFPLSLEPSKVYWSSSSDFKEYEAIQLDFS